MADAAPEGFVDLRGPGFRIVYDAELAGDLEALGWLEPAGYGAMGEGSAEGFGRGEVVRRELPRAGASLVVRSVLHGGLLGGFLRGALHSPERAFAEQRTTARLREAGAPVPRPAFAAARRRGLVWNARVATFFETDTCDVLAFLQKGPSQERILAAAGAAGRAIRRFHDAGGCHADLHVKNLLLRETPEGPEVILVDLDGATHGEPPDAARRMYEIGRLYRSGLKRGTSDQIGFEGNRELLAGYVGDDATLGAALSRAWPRERRRVAAHALGYDKRSR